MPTLVVCIGNASRGDDGVAHRIAEQIRDVESADVRIVAVTQLDVVMAAEVASASRVLFVDAERREHPPVRIDSLAADTGLSAQVHSLSPAGLLALSRSLYGRAPQAALVSVAAPSMGHTQTLSETAKTASTQAVFEIRRILATA